MTNETENLASPTKRVESLNREVLVKTALEIVDRDRLASLSMRKLGAELGADPMATCAHRGDRHTKESGDRR